MPSINDLKGQLETAEAQGRGTDAGRIKKQLAALGWEAPKPGRARTAAAESRAAASDDDESAKMRAPAGRTTRRGRASET